MKIIESLYFFQLPFIPVLLFQWIFFFTYSNEFLILELYIMKPFGDVVWGAPKSSKESFMSQQRRSSKSRSKVIDKKWLVRIANCKAYKWVGEGLLCPGNLLGYSLIIIRKVGERGTSLSFLSRHHASIICSSFRLGSRVFLSLHGQARSTNYWFLSLQRAHPRDY